MKKIILFCLLFHHFFASAQCSPDITLSTGTFSTPLTESSTWIRTSLVNTTTTTMSSTVVIKLDAHNTDGYIELNPGFLSSPTTGAFIAQALNGCTTGEPAKRFINEAIENNIVIYPNPSKNIFYIKTDNLNGGTIEVYNILGVKILEQKFQKDTIAEIDLHNQPAEMFMVKIISKDLTTIKRIIKN